MAKQIRQVGRAFLYILPLVVLGAFLLLPQQPARASYSSPFWTNTSASPECVCDKCACEAPAERLHGVSVRTLDFAWNHFLFRMPGRVDDVVFALQWQSRISGQTEFGNGMLPSFMWSIEDRDTEAWVRRPDGLIVVYEWDGNEWSTADCNVHDTLTVDQNDHFVLTDDWGNYRVFDAAGMLDLEVDRNGNTRDYTYADYKLSAFTDDRGKSYTIAHNLEGFVSSITDPAGRTWEFDFDPYGNLETITTPATADQPSGISTTLDWDGYNRLLSAEDGRGHVTLEVAYVGTSAAVDTVTLDGDDYEFESYTGRTECEDPLGGIFRSHFSGANITQTDWYIDSQAEYATQYRYSGNDLVTIVYAGGNRTDLTRDGEGNLTERRLRVADTGTNQASDIVHTWTYGSPVPTSYTDPDGNETTYDYDNYFNLTEIVHPTVTDPDTQTASETFTYNGYGQRLTHVDEEGLRTADVYYDSGTNIGLLQKVQVGPDGYILETEFGYDSAGNVTSKEDARSNTWSYTWDSLRRLKESQAPSPLSHKVRYEYDGNSNVTEKEVENRDHEGTLDTGNPWFTTTYTYTNLDQVSTITEEIDASTTRTTSLYYDDLGRRYRVVKPEGNEERWTFDVRGLVLTHTRGYGTQDASTVTREYDDNANLVTLTDGRSNDTDFTVDPFNRRTRETNALGHYTTWDYDKRGNVTDVKRYASDDTLMQRSTRYYDERGRLWKTSDLRKDPSQTYADAVTEIERLKTGHVEVVTNARGKDTTYSFDVYHRVTAVADAAGNETSYTLDANGNRTAWEIEETDGASTVTHEYEATYDAVNRRLTTVEIDRTDAQNEYTTTSGFDSRSNLVWQVNAEGNPTRWTYDGLGRMIKRERALTFDVPETFTSAQVTEWAFDDNDRLVGHTDDGTNETTWSYDALDRATQMTYPDTSYATFEHDDADNVVGVVDPAGNEIEDTFDALNRNTARSVTLAQGWVGTTAETRTYDALNRILTNADNDYQVTYVYGVLGLSSTVYTETQEYVGGSALAKTVTTTHDQVGNKATEVYPSSLALAYTYNEIDRLSSISDGTSTIVSYTYWGSRLKGTTFQNGATQSNIYGGFRQDLTSVHHQTSTPATIVRVDYGYNKVHDRTYERFGGSGSSGDGFAYDKLRRLTNAWMGSTAPESPSGQTYINKIDYNYDDDGNRTSVVVTPYGQGSGTTSYTTNSLYQYTNVGGTGHSWDSNGNLTDDGTCLFEYNYKNLPVYVRLKSNNNLVVTYTYDALGRRVEKNLGSNVVERYIYSGLETIATYNAYDTWKQDFVFGQGIDQIVMLEQADILDFDSDLNTTETTRSFYHRNALGSVMEITDMLEATVVSYRYDPYGALTISVGGTPQSTDPLCQHWTYTGRFFDEETGLYYYRARYYSPTEGRFLQRDPLGYGPGQNVYEYVGSRPTCRRDPLGLDDGEGIAKLWEGLKEVVKSGYEAAKMYFEFAMPPGVLMPPAATVAVLTCAHSATSTARSAQQAFGFDGSGYDALRHCLWSCYMSRNVVLDGLSSLSGKDVAMLAGDARESANFHTDVYARGVNPYHAWANKEMDSRNNAVGRGCGKLCGESCLRCCLRQLRVGKLATLHSRSYGIGDPAIYDNSDLEPRPYPEVPVDADEDTVAAAVEDGSLN